MEEKTEKLLAIRQYCQAHSRSVLYDEPTFSLWDVYAGKQLTFSPVELRSAELKQDAQTGQPYLMLRFEEGRELALSDAGIAFIPQTANTGPIPELPAAVCLRDFHTLKDRLQHQLYGHPDETPSRDALRLVMMCVAILEGARAWGFDIAREERELDRHLQELEKRSSP